MNLPPIPEPIIAKSTLIEGGGIWGALYDAEQMQAYGQQCREAALLDAMNATTPFDKVGRVIAAAIGALK